MNKPLVQNVNLWIGSAAIVIGTLQILSGLAFLLKIRKFIPHLYVDDEDLQVKKKPFSQYQSFHWSQIKSIVLYPYRIQFLLQDNRKDNLTYESNPGTSKEIKKVIRTIAASKQIEVTGG